MRVRRTTLLVMALGAIFGFVQPHFANAEQIFSDEHQIVVHAVVSERRMIVVDARENILEITSNTPKAVRPEVRLLAGNGAVVPLADSVRQQYEALLAQVKGNKTAIITPEPGPLAQLEPDFVSAAAPTLYQVTPDQRTRESYWIVAGATAGRR